MLGHDLAFLSGPAAIADLFDAHAHDKKAFIGHHPCAVWQLHLKHPLCALCAHIGRDDADFLLPLAEGGLFKGFSRLYSTAGCCPIFLTLQSARPMGETEKEYAIFGAYDQ